MPAALAPVTDDPLTGLFDRFVAERRYLKNVTPQTVAWYSTSFSAYHRRGRLHGLPTKASLQQFVVTMRTRGVRAVSVNPWLRCLNAFCRCLHQEGQLPELLRMPPLKIEQLALTMLTDAEIKAPRAVRAPARLHMLVCLLLDSGLRIAEALTLNWPEVDLNNRLVNARQGRASMASDNGCSSRCWCDRETVARCEGRRHAPATDLASAFSGIVAVQCEGRARFARHGAGAAVSDE